MNDQKKYHKIYPIINTSGSDCTCIPTGLIKAFGIRKAYYINNLVYKYEYCKFNKLLIDNIGFIYQMEEQSTDMGFSLYQLRKLKKEFKNQSILKTHMVGIPPKEVYIINYKILSKSL